MSFLDNLDSFEGGSKDPSAGTTASSSTAAPTKAGTSSSKIASTKGAASSSGTGSGAATTATASSENPDDPQAVLDFLDEIVANRDNRRSTTPSNNNPAGLSSSSTGSKKATSSATGTSGVVRSGSRNTLRDGETSSAGTSSSRVARDASAAIPPRKSGESTRSLNMTAGTSHTSTASQAAEKLQEAPLPERSSIDDEPKAGGWGWGSVWSQASNVLQQARTVAEEVSWYSSNLIGFSEWSSDSILIAVPSTASETSAQEPTSNYFKSAIAITGNTFSSELTSTSRRQCRDGTSSEMAKWDDEHAL